MMCITHRGARGALPLVGFLISLAACGKESEPTAPSLDGPSLQADDPSHPTPAPVQKLAFQSNRDGNAEIYTMNATGAAQVNRTNDPTSDYLPSWSPDGTRIAFLRAVNEGPDPNEPGQFIFSDRLFVMNADGTGVVDLSGAVGQVPNQVVAWSPDASTIAFSVMVPPLSFQTDIWLVHPDGTGLVPLTTDGLHNAGADWSPDGSKIAFVRNKSGGVSRVENRGIYVIKPDGTGLTQLTASQWDGQPTWSPGGQQIAFVRHMSAGGDDIFVMNANGSGETNLTNDPADDDSPSWSPNGSRIAFSSARTGSHQIFRMDSDGGNVTQLTTVDENFLPLWSPSGTYIVFTRRPPASTDFDVWRMSASGGSQIQLTTAGRNTTPSWKGSK